MRWNLMAPVHQARRTYTLGCAYTLCLTPQIRRASCSPHPAATGRGRNASRIDALVDAEIVDRQVAGEAAAARIDELELHVAA